MEKSTELIQSAELRHMLGGVSSMWILRKKNELPKAAKIGSRSFWKKSEIVDYIEAKFASSEKSEK